MVGLAGLEPATLWLRVRCSTGWAKGPDLTLYLTDAYRNYLLSVCNNFLGVQIVSKNHHQIN